MYQFFYIGKQLYNSYVTSKYQHLGYQYKDINGLYSIHRKLNLLYLHVKLIVLCFDNAGSVLVDSIETCLFLHRSKKGIGLIKPF